MMQNLCYDTVDDAIDNNVVLDIDPEVQCHLDNLKGTHYDGFNEVVASIEGLSLAYSECRKWRLDMVCPHPRLSHIPVDIVSMFNKVFGLFMSGGNLLDDMYFVFYTWSQLPAQPTYLKFKELYLVWESDYDEIPLISTSSKNVMMAVDLPDAFLWKEGDSPNNLSMYGMEYGMIGVKTVREGFKGSLYWVIPVHYPKHRKYTAPLDLHEIKQLQDAWILNTMNGLDLSFGKAAAYAPVKCIKGEKWCTLKDSENVSTLLTWSPLKPSTEIRVTPDTAFIILARHGYEYAPDVIDSAVLSLLTTQELQTEIDLKVEKLHTTLRFMELNASKTPSQKIIDVTVTTISGQTSMNLTVLDDRLEFETNMCNIVLHEPDMEGADCMIDISIESIEHDTTDRRLTDSTYTWSLILTLPISTVSFVLEDFETKIAESLDIDVEDVEVVSIAVDLVVYDIIEDEVEDDSTSHNDIESLEMSIAITGGVILVIIVCIFIWNHRRIHVKPSNTKKLIPKKLSPSSIDVQINTYSKLTSLHRRV